MTLARRVAGALMRFGNSTSTKELLLQVENKTDEELLDLAEKNGMPTPLPLVTGIKPGKCDPMKEDCFGACCSYHVVLYRISHDTSGHLPIS